MGIDRALVGTASLDDQLVATDEWARFVIGFATRGPANGEQITPLLQAIVQAACAWAHRRKLALDPSCTALVKEHMKRKHSQ